MASPPDQRGRSLPPRSSPSIAPAPAAPASSRSRLSAPPADLASGFLDPAARKSAEQIHRASLPPASLPPNPVLLALEAQRRSSVAPSRAPGAPAPRIHVYEPGMNTRLVRTTSGIPWSALLVAGLVAVLAVAFAAYLIFR